MTPAAPGTSDTGVGACRADGMDMSDTYFHIDQAARLCGATRVPLQAVMSLTDVL